MLQLDLARNGRGTLERTCREENSGAPQPEIPLDPGNDRRAAVVRSAEVTASSLGGGLTRGEDRCRVQIESAARVEREAPHWSRISGVLSGTAGLTPLVRVSRGVVAETVRAGAVLVHGAAPQSPRRTVSLTAASCRHDCSDAGLYSGRREKKDPCWGHAALGGANTSRGDANGRSHGLQDRFSKNSPAVTVDRNRRQRQHRRRDEATRRRDTQR